MPAPLYIMPVHCRAMARRSSRRTSPLVALLSGDPRLGQFDQAAAMMQCPAVITLHQRLGISGAFGLPLGGLLMGNNNRQRPQQYMLAMLLLCCFTEQIERLAVEACNRINRFALASARTLPTRHRRQNSGDLRAIPASRRGDISLAHSTEIVTNGFQTGKLA